MLINKKTYKIVAIITLCMCNTLHCVVEPGSKQDTGATAIKSANLSTQKVSAENPKPCPPSPPRLRPSKEPPLTDGQKLDDEPEFKLPPAVDGDYDAFELLHPAEADNALKIFNTEAEPKDGLQSRLPLQLSAALQKAKTQQNIPQRAVTE